MGISIAGNLLSIYGERLQKTNKELGLILEGIGVTVTSGAQIAAVGGEAAMGVAALSLTSLLLVPPVFLARALGSMSLLGRVKGEKTAIQSKEPA